MITHHEHIGLPKRLRLASQFVYHAEGGWLNALLNLMGLITLLGLFNFNNPPNTTPVLLTCSGAYATTLAQACQLDPTP